MGNPLILAEIGLNHNGDMDLAKKLIDMAVDAGCDLVKFQKRDIDICYTNEFLDSPRESPWGTTQRQQKEGLEFGKTEYDEIDRYCKVKGIGWFASTWDMASQSFLRQYNLKHNKIASAMLTHRGLVEMVAKEGKHTFISTGMSTYKDIDWAVNAFKKHGCPFTLMHTTSLYPCPDSLINLGMIKTLQERYSCPVGYSNHSPGILSSALAVSLDATAIEIHITHDRSAYGSDQSASIEKRGLEYMVRDCKLVGTVIGDGVKEVIPEEMKVAKKLRYFEAEVLCKKG